VRVEVRAVIFINGRLVVTDETRQGQPHSALPGGGVERWESLDEALVREVREETGLVIEPGRLVYVAEVVARYKFHDVDSAAATGVLPPILPEIARDAAAGWPEQPRWLGNLWDSSL